MSSAPDDAAATSPAETNPQTTESQPPAKPRRARWWLLGLILAIAAAIQGVKIYNADGDNSEINMSALLIWPPTAIAVTVWWVLLSGLRWRTRAIGFVIAAIVFGAFSSLYKFDGLSGDFIPEFALRSAKTPEQLAQEFFESQSATKIEPTAQLEITDADWPQFRGPARDGIVRGEVIRTNWNENPPEALWRHPIGPGWSSFAVVGDFAFTQEQRGEDEAVVCYQANTGEQIWTHTDKTRYSTTLGGTGPRATPTVNDSRLYALGATGTLNCLDPTTGSLIGSKTYFRTLAQKISPEAWLVHH